jgi:hypothetical protein
MAITKSSIPELAEFVSQALQGDHQPSVKRQQEQAIPFDDAVLKECGRGSPLAAEPNAMPRPPIK